MNRDCPVCDTAVFENGDPVPRTPEENYGLYFCSTECRQDFVDEDVLTCPDCGNPLRIDEEWELVDASLVGTTAKEPIKGDYAHANCPE